MSTPTPQLAPPAHQRPRFGGIFGKEAIQGLIVDTLGILGPKLVVARGSLNRTEEWVLEGLEDIVFYFTVPAVGLYGFSKLFQSQLKTLGTKISSVALGKALPPALLKNRFVLGAKTGTLLATIAVAAGMEFLVPHVRNFITAKAYNAKNFTAVANLEAARSTVKAGESDPVEKAKSRILPVALSVAGLVGLAFCLPKLVAKSSAWQKAAQTFTKYVDFGSSSPFDMSKPILAILALVGLGGYLDATRDKLELKEVATRVALFTIPYYLFGKELAGNLLGRLIQNQHVKLNGKSVAIKSLVPFINPKLPKSSFLDFNQLVSNTHVVQTLDKLKLPASVKSAIVGKHTFIGYARFILSALVVGVVANLVAFHQTKQRHQEAQKANATKESHTNFTFQPILADPLKGPHQHLPFVYPTHANQPAFARTSFRI